MNILHRIKSTISETYRIENGFGLSPIRNKRELKALIRFCERELREDSISLNHDQKEVLETTLELYNENIINDHWSCGSKDLVGNIYDYIEEHVSYYWS